MGDRQGLTLVLVGGWTAEAEVSRASGQSCLEAAQESGWQCELLEVSHDIAAVLIERAPDRVFNALHGQVGEDGNIQGLLNLLRIPYTHSGLLASSIAMDKPTTKSVLADSGIAFPPDLNMAIEGGRIHIDYDGAVVVKPRNDGSSIGVAIASNVAGLPTTDHWPPTTQLMAEPYIPGLELTVSVLDGEPLTVTEITQSPDFYNYQAKYDVGGSLDFYNYQAKYDVGGSLHRLPARVDKMIFDQAMEWASLAHHHIGCRGVSRADFRYDHANAALYMLEINTQPGMTATSLMPEQAQYKGIAMTSLIDRLLELAQCD